jgi:hypothetical protein
MAARGAFVDVFPPLTLSGFSHFKLTRKFRQLELHWRSYASRRHDLSHADRDAVNSQ